MSATGSPHRTSLAGRTAIVTGAGRGIGKAIAGRFAEAGARVVVHYRSDAAEAEAVAGGIRDAGGEAFTQAAELTDPRQVETLVAAAVDRFGSLDVLVNNAGVFPTAPLLELDADDWAAMQRANVESAFLCTQAAARRMIDQGGGAIVNVASISARSPGNEHSHYNASKAAMVMLTRSAAQELGPRGIRVNAVSPGLVFRPGIREDWPDGVQRFESRAPLGRLVQPDDVANACLFLASDAAGGISGHDLVVDAGVLAASIY